nr:TQO small subunit DoxA domain-containing protein [Sulfobacillus thermosulfidooxidans]
MQVQREVRQPAQAAVLKKQSIGMLIVAMFLTLWAYQFEHHGLWGKLVNYNKAPKLVLTGTTVSPHTLNLEVVPMAQTPTVTLWLKLRCKVQPNPPQRKSGDQNNWRR